MSKTVQVKNIILGAGMPKICIPLVGEDVLQLEEQLVQAKKAGADLLEWRADLFAGAENTEEVLKTLAVLHKKAGEVPLLFTFRTKREGGGKKIAEDAYVRLCTAVADSGLADMLDIEWAFGAVAQKLAQLAKRQNMITVLSNHDFDKTPPQAEIVRRLHSMQSMGADLPKIAVMPQTAQDVLCLLSASEQYDREGDAPAVTMAMGKLGAVSRFTGEVFGSAVTFGTAGQSSAPGQIEAGKLRVLLEALH